MKRTLDLSKPWASCECTSGKRAACLDLGVSFVSCWRSFGPYKFGQWLIQTCICLCFALKISRMEILDSVSVKEKLLRHPILKNITRKKETLGLSVPWMVCLRVLCYLSLTTTESPLLVSCILVQNAVVATRMCEVYSSKPVACCQSAHLSIHGGRQS